MSDLNVVAVLTAKPGAESVLQQALSDLVAPTRAEGGCVSYELFQSAADPATFVTVERWQSQSDLDAHMQTAHIAHALEAAEASFAVPLAIHPLIPVSD